MGIEEGTQRWSDELMGVVLGNCTITAVLGEGGMATVYRARQEHLDRDVAVKVLPPYYASDPAFVERFKLEARAMAQLSHPHIVVVHDTGEDHGRLFIVMEYVGGGTLKDRMTSTLPMGEVTRIVREVAGALAYAHAKGIVHRDVKPVNVLMDGGGRAVLSDFGIAKILATSLALTRTGAGVGTPEYMSPEQCRGGSVDARSDIYALGILLYEMLTGRTPFEADNYTALAHAQVYDLVPPPSRLNPRISPAVQAVVLKALEKDPAERFQQGTDLAVALEQAMAVQMPLSGREPAPGYAPAPIAAEIICPRCHGRNGARQQFCSTCGLALGQNAPASPAPRAPTSAGWLSCPKCRARNRPIDRYCTTCGQSLLASAPGPVCGACGARNATGMRFCTACGHTLA